MAIVNAIKFDRYSGAMISDEEYWFLRRRRSYFSDCIHPLLSEEISDKYNLEAIYGGTGYPQFHFEVVEKARRRLKGLKPGDVAKGSKNVTFDSVENVGKLTLEIIHQVAQKYVNNHLKFVYGFTIDDFNRGYFVDNDQKYEIKQDVVKENVKKIINGSAKDPLKTKVYDNRGILIGCDQESGFMLFYYDIEKLVMAFTSGGYEAIGIGKYAAGMTFADLTKKKFLKERREGFGKVEGMIELIMAAVASEKYYHEVGGYFPIMILDGRGKKHSDRLIELNDDRAKLSAEVVFSYRERQIVREDANYLIDNLVFQNMPVDDAEEELFKRAKCSKELELRLRGYKFGEIQASPPDEEKESKAVKGVKAVKKGSDSK
jgi:hypothetical protein